MKSVLSASLRARFTLLAFPDQSISNHDLIFQPDGSVPFVDDIERQSLLSGQLWCHNNADIELLYRSPPVPLPHL